MAGKGGGWATQPRTRQRKLARHSLGMVGKRSQRGKLLAPMVNLQKAHEGATSEAVPRCRRPWTWRGHAIGRIGSNLATDGETPARRRRLSLLGLTGQPRKGAGPMTSPHVEERESRREERKQRGWEKKLGTPNPQAQVELWLTKDGRQGEEGNWRPRASRRG